MNYEKTYVGFTNDIDRRLAEHNKGKSRFTKNYKPWKIIYTEEKETKEEAIKREKYFKGSAGRRKIKLLLRPDSSAG